ncbi:MAG TPA: diversity-generating retroelement protein Avd [Blastocatellia bacterium]|nr:diversity-generating retroelement protein Avd [Blastocatellia bacterium]
MFFAHPNRLPRDHHFLLRSRITNGFYDLLEQLIQARYAQKKLTKLEAINSRLDVLRYQTRLLRDLSLMDARRYKHVSGLVNEIVKSLGGWIKQQKQVTT